MAVKKLKLYPHEDALEGIINGKKASSRRYQMIDNIIINGVCRYEEEG